ncbi:MAG: DUF3298 and DUF4163 domain-containing protein [candidate division KSB1 bacterium]|nr:DUF3298 and DUF4163 domain-containing protein [candidate division KSB1 bacterium]MDZ7275301.1 DUF3298 and DUF4163 domain-containing protein [candidate division KSB1 bacterium]MDZ7287469.1 DUF3298 and DUF4163 domain-containing protein [candidate division KSB1 bacterium]MDZ7299583.1 DUF3298 and DUF4163 domain-containing protein [candidate division KSB1 bacterium]MDZ7350447.1 DUF3298 and DUF4163 domain-containing protein [candidate division KSB1 bacterium]
MIHSSGPLSCARIRFFTLLALLCAAPLAARPAFRGYYTGMLGGRFAIQMDLTIDSSAVITGNYFYESVGERLHLQGRLGTPTLLEELDADENITGRFAGSLAPPYAVFEGTWTSADGTKSLPFTLSRVAEYHYYSTADELIQAEAAFPRFLGKAPALQQLNTRMHTQAMVAHGQFVHDSNEMLAGEEMIGGMSFGYSHDCSIMYYSEDLISLLVTEWSFTGGAHGNTSYAATNYWLHDGRWQTLALADLFLPDADYLAALTRQCRQSLQAQGAAWVQQGEMQAFTAEDLQVFNVMPRALLFTFAPYQVGPYAQGTFQVRVPYHQLGGILNPAGPLQRRLFYKPPQ